MYKVCKAFTLKTGKARNQVKLVIWGQLIMKI